MERLISYKQMHEINKYFKLFEGKSALLSEMKAAKPAIEVLIFDRKLVAQQHLFDKDETIVPSKEIVKIEIPDDGEYYSNGDKI